MCELGSLVTSGKSRYFETAIYWFSTFKVWFAFIPTNHLALFYSVSLFAPKAIPRVFIGPESDHWLCLSLTNWLTHCRLVNLIDVTLACKDDNSNLLRLLLLLMLMMRIVLTTVWCRFGRWSLVIVFVQTLSTRFQGVDKILKLKFGHCFAADTWLWLWSSILVKILKLGLVKIFKFKFCRNADVWLRFEVGAWSRFWRCLIKICVRTCDMT